MRCEIELDLNFELEIESVIKENFICPRSSCFDDEKFISTTKRLLVDFHLRFDGIFGRNTFKYDKTLKRSSLEAAK